MKHRLTRAGTLTGITAIHLGLLLSSASANLPVTPPEPMPMTMVNIAPEVPQPQVAPAPPKPQVVQQVAPKTPAPKPQVKAIAPRPERTISTPVAAAAPSPAVETPATTTPVVAEAPPAPPAPPAPVVPPTHIGSHLGNPKPIYPALSLELGESGNVGLRVQVSADGKAQEVSLARSSGFARLDRAAIQAVKQWRFKPATRGNEAIPFTYTFSVEFDINKA